MSYIQLTLFSHKGTVIRVFNVSDGQGIYEFRRGYARCVSIHSLSFSADSFFLCASSDKETVHIFKLEDLNEALVISENITYIMSIFKVVRRSSYFHMSIWRRL